MCKNVRRVREAVPPCDLVENSTFFAGFEVFAQRGSLKNPKKLIVHDDYVCLSFGNSKVMGHVIGARWIFF